LANLSKEEIEAAAKERDRLQKEEEEERKQRLEAAIELGEVQINASMEVVDKRALLSKGLNVSKAKLRSMEAEKEQDRLERRQKEMIRREENERRREEAEKRRQKEEQARRMLVEAEKQAKEVEKRKAEEKEREKHELAAKMARKVTDDQISDAKARYLARRKAQQGKGLEDSDSD
jgi:hypothetical protein